MPDPCKNGPKRNGTPLPAYPSSSISDQANSPNGHIAADEKSFSSSSCHVNEEKNESQGDRDERGSFAGIATATAHATIPAWANMAIVVSLIFGGCCANVFALEAIIKDEPSSGPLITLAQFVTVALLALPRFLSFSAGAQSLFLRPRAIPLKSWVAYTAFFATVNLLNNWAFAYRISVPLHIILRSGGPVASMIVGYLYNSKRYSRNQMLAVAVLTLGVASAALADADAKGQSMEISFGSDSDSTSPATFLTGFIILALAMILSAFQGVYADRLYETYGRSHWREALLYSHMLSLPLFLPTYPQLSSQLRALFSTPPMLSSLSGLLVDDELPFINSTSTVLAAVAATSAPVLETTPKSIGSVATSLFVLLSKNPLIRSILTQTPIKIAYLLLNAATQYLCIRGVHLLSAKSSSLTVTIVLNIRKLVSLLLSIYLFGNNLASGVMVGAAFVFAGGSLYGFEGARLRKEKDKNKIQ